MRNNELICLSCNGGRVIKKGIRKLKMGNVQKYFCKDCGANFTNKKLGNSSYSANVILEALNNYNLGMTLEESSKKINMKFHVKTYPRLISSWLKKYEEIVPYKKFRQGDNGGQEMVEKQFDHKQPYLFKYHKTKVNKFFNKYFSGLKNYLLRVVENCPNEFFVEENSRASQTKFNFNLSELVVREKRNFACDVANFAVKSIKTNYERHDFVENFLLVNDTATLACEVPIWLDFRDVPSELSSLVEFENVLTGHVDILQCRFGLVYVLDYKPEASKENKGKVISQLFSYALALSVQTGIWLRNFRCAWFDEGNYYEFSPGEIVLDYLKDEGLGEEILRKYRLDVGAQRYFTSKEFNKNIWWRKFWRRRK
jgi:transposase-like protein